MVPTPQKLDKTEFQLPQENDGDRIVISGMSGLFPKSFSVQEFSDILYNKVNPVSSDDLRFTFDHPELVPYAGSVPDLHQFDAQFFKVHFRQAHSMDVMSRKILEQAYQAIYDAGLNPEQLSGTNVGVFVGACFSEMDKSGLYDASARTGFGISGCSKSMFANRVSYWLNGKGPSVAIDTACTSSISALEQACMAMMNGRCDCAVVAGSFLCIHPHSAINLARVIHMSRDGKTFSFDERAQGCSRSEAISVLFLQKAKNALRIYAEVLHVKSEYVGMIKENKNPKFGFYRELNSTIDFLKSFYKEAGVPTEAVEYFEAVGSASPEADKVELQAIQELFCKNRSNKPLLIGSIMSNIGYSEAASGLSAVTKVLLGYHNGKMAANLHCGQPRKDIEALHDGRMHILDEHQTFDRSYVAINGLSVTGVNAHVLLHGRYKPKNLNRYKTSIPHLVAVTGRHENAVKWILENLKSNPVDAEQLALLRNIHKTSIAGHVGRGYLILQSDKDQKTVILSEKAEYADLSKRPLWFVYSGMGSQWAEMGLQLMRVPIFAAAIERCRVALKPKGLDIVEIITSPDETIFNNILHSFVGIAAVQIGLTDILHAMGIQPDGIIGHSVGELGCAYADGCLTAEEMILSAYYRGLVSLETEFIHGSMAAVGLGYKQISELCPPEIEVACHNGPDSSTISGPSDVMRDFVAKLTADGIFAKEVPCSNIAYHSRYIADAGPGLLSYLKKAIPNPKVRSKRWFSTSVSEARWNEPIAEFCSAEYLTNNLLSPVLFEETSLLLPKDAVLVEIAPHGLLQAILTRSLRSCKSIPLTRRKHPDNTLFMLEALGKLFMEGFNFDVQALYPKVDMPVSTGTPFLAHLVKWSHDETWPLPIHCIANKKIGANCDFTLALHDKEYSYVRGHTIRGYTLFPLAASLMLVWDTLSMMMGVPKRQTSIKFKNIRSYVQPVLHDGRQLKLSVTIHRGEGSFEIVDGISKVATGFIEATRENTLKTEVNNEIETVYFTGEDIYQLLRDRDYSYGGQFQSINCADESLSEAIIEWRDNWATFIDGMLQLNILRQQHYAVSQPTYIRRLLIDVKEQKNILHASSKLDGKVLIKAEVVNKSDSTRCGGVVLQTIKYQNLPPVNDTKMSLKTLTFVPHFKSKLDISTTLEVYLQLVAENLNKDDIKVAGVQSQAEEGLMFKEINKVFNNLYGIKVNYKHISGEDSINRNTFEGVDLILVQNLSSNRNVLQRLQAVLQQDQFVVTEENVENPNYEQHSKAYRVLSSHLLSKGITRNQSVLQLVRWGPTKALTGITTVCVRKKSDIDFLTSIRANLTPDQHLLVISSFPTTTSLKELVAVWRRDSTRNKIYLITVNNSNIDDVEKNLKNVEFAFNYVDHSKWGSEFYLSMSNTIEESKNVTLQSAKSFDYNSLQWVQAPDLAESGVTVNVHYAGITSNDLKHANGSLFSSQIAQRYGMDFSGTTERGQPVMGVVPGGAASTQVRAQPEFLWPVPAHWSLEDAATVPLAYLQAFYLLGIKVELKRGCSIFVHGGAGALGQAIISIALAYDCEVFTTVSNVQKKKLLLKLFPKLKADHIGKSRNTSFIDILRNNLGDRRCDIIISSAKGSQKDLNIKGLAFGGVLLDISQIQNREEYGFGFSNLREQKCYSRVDFSLIFEPENIGNLKAVNKMISDGITRGYVRPLSRVTYTTHEVLNAFKLLSDNSHIGRVLLHMNVNTIQAQQRLIFSPDHCYLILCNSTSFGIQLADRLVTNGVKLIYVHIQKQSSYLQHKIRSWQELGVKVGISSERLNSQKTVASLLTNAARLGPLEGVIVTTDDKNNDIYSNLISDLDAETKKNSCSLKHFVVTYFGNNSIEKDVCLNRLYHQLPATVITIPELKSESYNNYSKWRSAVDALESALQNTRGVILAHLERGLKPSLLKQIESVTGLSVPENTPKSTTLKELGIKNNELQSLCAFLRIQYNLGLEEEQVSLLTIEQLLQEERNVIDFGFEVTKGLNTFFNYIDPDEIEATVDMVYLPTLAKGASQRDDDYESSKVNLCIVPGIEGHRERFRVLCQRLKLPALVLQPGVDHPYETVREMAERFVQVYLQKNEIDDTFHLLGFESGVFVALEMAAILEEQGLTGKVFCVGCAPHELSDEMRFQLAEFENADHLENGVLRHIYTLMDGEDSTPLGDTSQKTCSEKIEAYVRILHGRVAHTEQYARTLMEYAVARINYMLSCKGREGRQLRSQIVLLRAALGNSQLQLTDLQKLSTQTVVVHQLESSLANITSDLRCAAIINEHLDPAILEEFETKNICNTYLLNADSFISMQYVS